MKEYIGLKLVKIGKGVQMKELLIAWATKLSQNYLTEIA